MRRSGKLQPICRRGLTHQDVRFAGNHWVGTCGELLLEGKAIMSLTRLTGGLVTAIAVLGLLGGSQMAYAGYSLGSIDSYGILFTGDGNNAVQINNGTLTGNVGIADPNGSQPAANLSGPLTVNGNFVFAGTSNITGIGGNVVVNGSVSESNATVMTEFNTLQSLSTTLGAEAGSNLVISVGNNATQTVNAASGELDANGNRVFNVTSFNESGNNNALVVNGDGAGDSVVFNLSSSVNANFTVGILLNGLTSDQVLFNIYGGSNASYTGGPTLQISANGATLAGDFLDPNGDISMNHAILDGRLIGGDMHNVEVVSGFQLVAPVPEPSTWAMVGLGLAGLLAIRRRKA